MPVCLANGCLPGHRLYQASSGAKLKWCRWHHADCLQKHKPRGGHSEKIPSRATPTHPRPLSRRGPRCVRIGSQGERPSPARERAGRLRRSHAAPELPGNRLHRGEPRGSASASPRYGQRRPRGGRVLVPDDREHSVQSAASGHDGLAATSSPQRQHRLCGVSLMQKVAYGAVWKWLKAFI